MPGRVALATLAMAGLGGCGLPPAVMGATLALDGVSYLLEGRSTADLVLSEVMDADCRMLRLVTTTDPICRMVAETSSEGEAEDHGRSALAMVYWQVAEATTWSDSTLEAEPLSPWD